MKNASRRAAAKAAPRRKKTPSRRLTLKAAPDKLSAEEVSHLEGIVKRFADSEKAWQRMNAPDEGGDQWSQVEEHLLRGADADKRWKFFSK